MTTCISCEGQKTLVHISTNWIIFKEDNPKGLKITKPFKNKYPVLKYKRQTDRKKTIYRLDVHKSWESSLKISAVYLK